MTFDQTTDGNERINHLNFWRTSIPEGISANAKALR